MNMTPIKKRSLVDQIYDELRNGIIEMRFEGGEHINVNALQQKLGVSCTPIREAINRLQQEGLIVYENNVGATILQISDKDVVDIQQLATALHCTAVRLSMSRPDCSSLIGELESQFNDYCHAQTVKDEVYAVKEFFGAYYHNCDNERLEKSLLSIQGQQLLLRNMYAVRCKKRAMDAELFELILFQTKAGDIKGVCSSMEIYSERIVTALTAKS